MAVEKVETVSWINRWGDPEHEDYFEATDSKMAERILRMYGVEYPIDLPFQTHIPVDEISGLEDETLRDALEAQKEDREQDASDLLVPVVFMPSRAFSHDWLMSRRPPLTRQKKAQDHSPQSE